jgi:hypothetical protein
MGCHRVKPGEVKPGNDGFGQAITIMESLTWSSKAALTERRQCSEISLWG